jgi:hypothetical protein
MHIYEKQDIVFGELNCKQLQSRLCTKMETKTKMKLQIIKIVFTISLQRKRDCRNLKVACGTLWLSGTLEIPMGKPNAESYGKVGPTLKQFERFSSSLTQDVYSMTWRNLRKLKETEKITPEIQTYFSNTK